MQLSALLLAVACGEPSLASEDTDAASTTGDTGPRTLVTPSAWMLAASGADPFAAMRPADATCDEAGLNVEAQAEGDAFEISTDLCNYATVQQAALNEAGVGDELMLRFWHYDLEADQPASGYLGVAIGEEIVWEQDVPIPSPAGLVTDSIALDRPIAFGDPISVHVHNHGVNTWGILEIQVQ